MKVLDRAWDNLADDCSSGNFLEKMLLLGPSCHISMHERKRCVEAGSLLLGPSCSISRHQRKGVLKLLCRDDDIPQSSSMRCDEQSLGSVGR